MVNDMRGLNRDAESSARSGLRRRVPALALYSLLAISGLNHVWAQTAACDRIATELDRDVRALAEMAPIGDNSAPRETNRLLRISIAAQLIQANISLLAANKCKAPDEPVSDRTYWANAFDCSLAEGAGRNLERCNQSSWNKQFKANAGVGADPVNPNSSLIQPAKSWPETSFDGVGHYYLPIQPGVIVRATPEVDGATIRILSPDETVYVESRYERFAKIRKNSTSQEWVDFSQLARKKFD